MVLRRGCLWRAATLNGAPLPAPRLLPVAWAEGQTFTGDDDAAGAIPVPAVAAAERAAAARVSELDVSRVSGCRPGHSFARVVADVLTEAECAALVAAANAKGFTPALVNQGNGTQRYLPRVRDGSRTLIDSPPFARWLLDVVRPHVPPAVPWHASFDDRANPRELPPGAPLAVAGLNPRFRFLCYSPGHRFKPHRDGHQWIGAAVSVLTLHLYLHSSDVSDGGATVFLDNRREAAAVHVPTRGTALLFTQELLHEGASVAAGYKYTVRSDVLFAPAVA